MITPYFVFWIMWLLGLIGLFFTYPPTQPPLYRSFGLSLWLLVMMACLAIMAKGSPFSGW